ncbi:MAG TPA: hypothetical protein VK809_11330, partial [Bacteroidia bacterium]|nr:hypothetical protein [Bacteroidia bacterium]
STTLLKVYEDSMKSLQYVRINARTDKEKEVANGQLWVLMDKALSIPGSFDYPFDSLKTIGIEISPDKQFRIITWDVPKSGCTFSYYGFIQSYNAKKKKYDLFVLKDHTADIPNPQSAACPPDKWLGMLYYKIIKEKGSKTYTLLAWEGCSKQITRKVIDMLTFNAQGIPSFGKAVFQKLPATYKGNPKRILFEYSADVSMSLRYDDSKGMILFDLLGPIEDGLEGQHQYYGPSFQVDGMKYSNGFWTYAANVQARNPNDKSDPKYKNPKNHDYKINKPIYQPQQ